jgi:hypothetical protein
MTASIHDLIKGQLAERPGEALDGVVHLGSTDATTLLEALAG